MAGPDVMQYALAATASSSTGTVTLVAGNPTVTGAGTNFMTVFKVGDNILVNGEEHTVAAVTSNTSLSTINNWNQSGSGLTAYCYALASNTLAVLSTPVPWPKGAQYVPYSQPLDLGDGSLRAGGWPTTQWAWGFLTRNQRNILRSFWPASPSMAIPASALLRIRTAVNEDNDVFANFVGQAIWPQSEPKDAQRRVPFSLKFRALVPIDPY